MKLMTLNLNFYGDKHGPWEKRRELIVKVLKREQPDVVALQAVCKPKSGDIKDQAAELAAASEVGYRAVHFRGLHESSTATCGQAFLSKFEIESLNEIPLKLLPETREDRYQRFIYSARLQTALGPLDVFNCHFSWEDAQNVANVSEALAGIGFEARPAVVAGDFNATPDKPALRLLSERGLIDLWPLKHQHEYGATFESNLPKMRIDYILANRLCAPLVRNVYIVQEELEKLNVRMSDHLGLVAILEQ